jgi:putative nucleotidyltransferase with HDIG domain
LNERLRSKGAVNVLGDIESLPVMSATHQEIIDMLNSPDCSPRKVGKMIARDIGMSAKILQLVNSAFYGTGSQIADAVQAVVYLGLKTIKALVLTNGVFCELPEDRIERFSVEALQQHCVRVGSLARTICMSMKMTQDDMDMASMAGILHDAGKMILISKLPEKFAEAIEISRNESAPLHEVERRVFDISHAELGGCLLDLWGIPTKIIEATTYHHEPPDNLAAEFGIMWAVHIADAIDHELCCGLGDGSSRRLDLGCITRLGLAGMYQQWRRTHLNIQQEAKAYAAAER